MTSLDLLQEAMNHMKEAEKCIKQAEQENESLSDYHGYSLAIIAQELNRFSDNAAGYLGRNSCLEEIINDCGDKWQDNS